MWSVTVARTFAIFLSSFYPFPTLACRLCDASLCEIIPFLRGGSDNQSVDGLAHTSYTVHCRRRKIRCLVATDDTQGRCENCIRLRKECQFFPVDQQPPVEKKSRPSSRIETPTTDRPATTPIASSPTTNLGPDSVETFYPYQPMPLNTSGQDMASFNVGSFPGNPMSGFPPGMLAHFF